MKKNIKYNIAVFFVSLLALTSCTDENFSLGNLTTPSNIVVNAEVVGKDATHPNGNGSGDVKFTITGDNVLGYKIDYDDTTPVSFVFLPKGTATYKFTKLGVNTFRVTVVASGAGGTSTNVTKEVTVNFTFDPGVEIITNLTNDTSKTWIVDKSVQGHFGVGPWDSPTPIWWEAGINEKVNCCNCFYTTTFTFTKVVASGTFSLTVASPDGAFTKTGANAGGLPGIPASGAEGCYSYAGGTSAFSFVPANSGTAVPAVSTKVAVKLEGNNTFIGYGALQKDYEILKLTPTFMYLRIQGTETGNSWYLKLIPII